MKVRIDKLLVERGLAQSRERAQALVLAGKVLVNEQKIQKAGTSVDAGAAVRLLGADLKYVSRGGLKLEHALAHWNINVAGRVCMDVGASTGGFTDCLLQHGAARVVAVDTGYGQLDYRLRQDVRVRLLENTNARYLKARDVQGAVEVVVLDVSFISATLVLPAVVQAAFADTSAERREMVILVKPQFEAGREQVGKGGVVRDPEAQTAAVDRVRNCVRALGFARIQVTDSPILGMEGNREFLLYARM
jgi:23S rRNA (cytidine1920-2'-O)/16S rRNA (cytidine1409-2'-O)-methyltransferase